MGTLLFGVMTGPDAQALTEQLHEMGPFIDGIELRLDHFIHIDSQALKTFILSSKIPIMLTLRHRDQGGSFSGSEAERLDLLQSLCSLKPAYVDLEYDVPEEKKKQLFEAHPHIQFLSSLHDFEGTPSNLEELYQKVKTPYAHIYKIAVTAHSSLDALKVLSFVQKHSNKDKIIGIAMGEEGRATRILAPIVGSFLTYAALHTTTAPGQLSAQELQETYRFRTLNRSTEIYSLIGDPIEKSLGALIHNAVFEKTHLNAVYLKMRLKQEELPPFFSLIRSLPFKGFSVTMPLKESVLPHLSQLSADSQAMGSCNTIQITPSALIGDTTDGRGALNAIELKGAVSGKHLVVIGAGGAAKAIILEAVKRGAFVTVINRTPEKAIQVAASVGGRGGGWELFPKICQTGYDVIINCIPDGELIDAEWILPKKIAMDIVYIPKNTPFLVKAAKKKCQLIYGYEMFIGQALEQERIWFPDRINFDEAFTTIENKVNYALTE